MSAASPARTPTARRWRTKSRSSQAWGWTGGFWIRRNSSRHSGAARQSRTRNLEVPGSRLARPGTTLLSDLRPHSRLQQSQPLAEAERVEGHAQILRILLEMGPAVGVDGNDQCIGKGTRGLDGVVGVHGEMEGTTGLRSAGKGQHDTGVEAPGDFGDTVEPGRVAADIDRPRRSVACRDDEADDIARQRLNPGRAVARGRGGDRQRMAIAAPELGGGPRGKTFGATAEAL